MDSLKSKLKRLSNKIKEDKKLQYFLIVILIAILAFFILFDFNESKEVINSDEISQYVNQLEEKLAKQLSKVQGCGEVSVTINVASGKETVLAMKTSIVEKDGKVEREETPVIINGKTVVVKELYPKIVGVLIVCEGANNLAVLNKIQKATTSLLDVNINQIEILAMK